jgi:hypothetical protein
MIKLKNLTIEQTAELVPFERMILLGYRGSVAHGMYVPSTEADSIDDKDIMGVYIERLEHYLGFGRQEVFERFIGEWDAVSYEVKKFIGLLLKQNPNVLSLLWLPGNYYIFKSELGQRLIDNRQLFASKDAYHSFSGYAHGQLKRMTHLNQESLADINRRSEELVERGVRIDESGAAHLPAGANAELVNLTRQYEGLRSKYFSGYMGNKRKRLVEKFGYDTKNAAHLIRILRMGIEFLAEGRLHVEREDKLELLAIKRGEWSLEKVQSEAGKLFELAREANVRSPLPPEVDKQKAEALCVGLVADYHSLSSGS